eukprot:COSAG05_NODE_7054_length_862_cov_0.585845_2_plen_140_part_00
MVLHRVAEVDHVRCGAGRGKVDLFYVEHGVEYSTYSCTGTVTRILLVGLATRRSSTGTALGYQYTDRLLAVSRACVLLCVLATLDFQEEESTGIQVWQLTMKSDTRGVGAEWQPSRVVGARVHVQAKAGAGLLLVFYAS